MTAKISVFNENHFFVAYLDNLYHWIQMFKFLALPIIEMPDYFQGRNPMERKVRGTSLDLSELARRFISWFWNLGLQLEIIVGTNYYYNHMSIPTKTFWPKIFTCFEDLPKKNYWTLHFMEDKIVKKTTLEEF